MQIDGASVYIVLCADNAYYTGLTRKAVETRVSEHNLGINADYTTRRRPVRLVWSAHFERLTDAIAMERQIKGWSRAKKGALIKGDYDALPVLAARRKKG
ncbi:GIY-YIG nuclease family protein [Methylocystis echinoides]|uniref:GIY-YIG nuclease family protein n=1 Tax=Methylocystis echinoides TaxID=29468 RepID=UPI00341E91DB